MSYNLAGRNWKNLIVLRIVCTDSKWILSPYTRMEFPSWSPGREFGKLIGWRITCKILNWIFPAVRDSESGQMKLGNLICLRVVCMDSKWILSAYIRTEIWKTCRLQNRLYDFKKDFSDCTGHRIGRTGIGEIWSVWESPVWIQNRFCWRVWWRKFRPGIQDGNLENWSPAESPVRF